MTNTTDADRLDALCAAEGATYERVRTPDGLVRFTLIYPTGDRVTGSGPTTTEALTALITRVQRIKEVAS